MTTSYGPVAVIAACAAGMALLALAGPNDVTFVGGTVLAAMFAAAAGTLAVDVARARARRDAIVRLSPITVERLERRSAR